MNDLLGLFLWIGGLFLAVSSLILIIDMVDYLERKIRKKD